jgi:uncharacterized protein YneF (UPF0154 family)
MLKQVLVFLILGWFIWIRLCQKYVTEVLNCILSITTKRSYETRWFKQWWSKIPSIRIHEDVLVDWQKCHYSSKRSQHQYRTYATGNRLHLSVRVMQYNGQWMLKQVLVFLILGWFIWIRLCQKYVTEVLNCILSITTKRSYETDYKVFWNYTTISSSLTPFKMCRS